MTGEASYNATAVHEKFKDLAELRAYCRKLIDLWDRDLEKPFDMKNEYAGAGGPLIWSYTQHVVELMRTVLDLSQQNRMIIAVPLIRLMTENAMTSIWIYLSPQAPRAVVHEGLRQRKAALGNILELGAEGFDQSNVAVVDKQLEDFAGEDLPAGRQFEQRCRQIVDGLGVYATWRIMSSLSHAGMALGDFYLEADETSSVGLQFNGAAELEYHEAWLGTAACMFLASMKLCNEVDGKGRHRAQVARAAKRMGITLDFALVDAVPGS